jgi:hypothetical protein
MALLDDWKAARLWKIAEPQGFGTTLFHLIFGTTLFHLIHE